MRVRTNALLRDMNVAVPADDERFIEVSESLRQLNMMIDTIKAGKKPKPWRSVYCMERSLSGVGAGEDADDTSQTMASCYVCGKTSQDVKYCSRCKTVRHPWFLLACVS